MTHNHLGQSRPELTEEEGAELLLNFEASYRASKIAKRLGLFGSSESRELPQVSFEKKPSK